MKFGRSHVVSEQDYEAIELLPSTTAGAGEATGDKIDVRKWREARVVLKVSAASGTSPDLAVYIEMFEEKTGEWIPLASQTGITATGVWSWALTNFGGFIRVRYVITGSDSSFTLQVGGAFKT